MAELRFGNRRAVFELRVSCRRCSSRCMQRTLSPSCPLAECWHSCSERSPFHLFSPCLAPVVPLGSGHRF